MHLGLISILYWTLFKILYRSRVNMHVINSIRGSLHLEMLKDSSLSIGDFLMSRGPLYIKCMEGAQLDIGDNVFFTTFQYCCDDLIHIVIFVFAQATTKNDLIFCICQLVICPSNKFAAIVVSTIVWILYTPELKSVGKKTINIFLSSLFFRSNAGVYLNPYLTAAKTSTVKFKIEPNTNKARYAYIFLIAPVISTIATMRFAIKVINLGTL